MTSENGQETNGGFEGRENVFGCCCYGGLPPNRIEPTVKASGHKDIIS